MDELSRRRIDHTLKQLEDEASAWMQKAQIALENYDRIQAQKLRLMTGNHPSGGAA